MRDKSPHTQHSAKKSGKAMKAKRLAKKAVAEHTSQVQNLTHGKKH